MHAVLVLIICILLSSVIICQNSKDDNCTTGFVKNEMSKKEWLCCSYFCEENMSHNYYNPEQCCGYPTCQKSYSFMCMSIQSDLPESSLLLNHTTEKSFSGIPSSSTYTAFVQIVMNSSLIPKLVKSPPVSLSTRKSRYISTEFTTQLLPTTSTLKVNDFTSYSQKIKRSMTVNGDSHFLIIACILTGMLVSIGLAVAIFVLRRKRTMNSETNKNVDDSYTPRKESQTNSKYVSCTFSESHSPTFSQVDKSCSEKASFLPILPEASSTLIDIEIEQNEVETLIDFIDEGCSSSDSCYLNMPREFLYDDIICHRILGNGYFGQVLHGTLMNYPSINHTTEVALKTPTTNKLLNGQDILCLQLELRILLFVGHHINIVRLLGAIKKPCIHGDLLLVTELCEFGDLRTYITSRKSSYEVHSNKICCNELALIIEKSHLCLSALLMYALQIANGAHYFTNCKTVIHRDLALRNMLLTKEHIVKIGDFGLAVNMPIYDVRSQKPLPTRWLSPESLDETNSVFTAQSDV